jgi:uncharacterized damage-inducible protein DinB
MSGPSEIVRAMFDYHLWSTESLIDHLETLPEDRLNEAVPGTYGSIMQTMTHLVDADDRYLQRMVKDPPPDFIERQGVPLATLSEDMREHAKRWTQMLDELDAGTLSATITYRDDYPDTFDAEGLLLLQAVHHGNDHRTQVGSALGAMGLEVPDLDVWEYWRIVRTENRRELE